MALMLGKLYDALRAADVPEDAARAAAEEAASSEATFRELRRDVDGATGGLRTDVKVVQAVTGVLSVLVIAVLWQLFVLRGEVSSLDARVGSLDARVASVDAKVGSLDARVATVEPRLTTLDSRTSAMAESLRRIEEQLTGRRQDPP